MGSSGPWFCGPMIPTEDRVLSFSSPMLSILLFYSHSLRIAARDPRCMLTFNSERKEKGTKEVVRAMIIYPFHQKSEFF